MLTPPRLGQQLHPLFHKLDQRPRNPAPHHTIASSPSSANNLTLPTTFDTTAHSHKIKNCANKACRGFPE